MIMRTDKIKKISRYNRFIVFTCFLVMGLNTISAQVGAIKNNPDKSAVLDLSGSGKGLLIPRINLVSLTDVVTIEDPVEGLTVYNTNANLVDGTGYYYWSSNTWKRILVSEKTDIATWALPGNTSTTSSNYLGTVNDADMVFKTNNNELMRVTSKSGSSTGKGALGIGVAKPDHKLDVDAGDGGIRFRGLPTTVTNVSTKYIVADSKGELTKTNFDNTAGQIIRIGVNAARIIDYGWPDNEYALRCYSGNTAALMGKAPNGASNFINTIGGSAITSDELMSAGNGSNARYRDGVTLPAGVYKVVLRINGYFRGSKISSSIDIKMILDNNEYSLMESIGVSNSSTDIGAITGIFTDILNLPTTQTVDFAITVRGGGSFTIIDKDLPLGGGISYRSTITYERLK